MDKNTEKSVAKSLEARPELLPCLPELLVDLWALGSSPDLVVQMLRPLNPPSRSTGALDLGCGKGAVSITLARELGFRVVGIDACKAFLEEAERKAAEFNVSELCQFRFGDIREFVNNANNFDIAIYASMGNVLGSFDECVGKLRGTIHPGGYIVIDDGFLENPTLIKRGGYEHYLPHDETLKQLTSQGDTLFQELLLTDEETRSLNEHYIKAMKRRAQTLIQGRPDLNETISRYIREQEIECELIEKHITRAIWLLKRAE